MGIQSGWGKGVTIWKVWRAQVPWEEYDKELVGQTHIGQKILGVNV